MGRFQLHFAKYMASYAALMIASCLLWNLAGAIGGEAAAADQLALGLDGASAFLIDFAVVAYPLYAAIKAIVKRLLRRFGTRRPMSAQRVSQAADAGARSSYAS